MVGAQHVARARGGAEPRIRALIALLAATQLGLGVFLAVAPGTFFDLIAGYGTRNDHFLRDVSTFYLAFGVLLIAALDRPSWRIPLLAFGAIQYGLHSINHLIDVGEGDPSWIGPFNVVSLVLLTAGFAYCLRLSAREH